MKKFKPQYIGKDKKVKKILIKKDKDPVFILGPCAIESRDHTLFMAEKIKKICDKNKVSWVFKSCYDKDCRSSPESFHGVGLNEGLKILDEVRNTFSVPVISDFSNAADSDEVGEVCDIVQVPAYLCRQTSILTAAAKTKRTVLIKKGQFMSPWNMKNSVTKILKYNNSKIILADRGTFFGYNMLINDMTAIKTMSELGFPVCFDATHSVQLPTSMGTVSGGQREFIPLLVRSAIAAGAEIIFMEGHNNPEKALSDANTVLNIKYLDKIIKQAILLKRSINKLTKDKLIEDVL